MKPDVAVIKSLIRMVIVPVNEFHVIRRGIGNPFGDADLVFIIIVVRAGAAEIHIAPHHRRELIFMRQIADAVYMAQHDGKAVLKAVLF